MHELLQFRPGQTFDVTAHHLRRVTSGQQGCLSGRALRRARHAKLRVDRNGLSATAVPKQDNSRYESD